MEHPKLLEAIKFMQETNSPGGEFLQFDGMKMIFKHFNETCLGYEPAMKYCKDVVFFLPHCNHVFLSRYLEERT